MTPPDEATLRRFLLGQLSATEAASVEAYIDTHPDTARLLERLVTPDAFVSALRGRTGEPAVPPEAEALARRLEGLSESPTRTGGSDSSAESGTARTEEDVCAFLAPSQGPGELGRLGDYRILRVLGRGGMGVVFEAEDTRLGRRVAVKAMLPRVAADPNARARFVREARAAATVEHDHVVPIHLIAEAGGVPYIVMPFLKGESLDDRLKRVGRLPVAEVVRIGREVAEGLAAAHGHGLVHRDIKPGNLWLEGPRDRVKVLDFGLARPLKAAHSDAEITQSGTIVGTPAYMSPEQARGRAVDFRTDLFSLGGVLYRACTGRTPFPGPDPASILMALAADAPVDPRRLNPRVPAPLAWLILQLLEKDPEKRPQSAREVAGLLAPAVEALPVDGGPRPEFDFDPDDTEVVPQAQPAGPRGPKRKRRRTALLVGIAAVILLIGGGLGAYKLVFATKDGTLYVEVNNDQETEPRFRNGKLLLVDPATGRVRYTLSPSERNKTLPPGNYQVRVEGADGVELSTDRFEMKKGGQWTIRVTAKAPAVAAKAGPKADPGDRFRNTLGMEFALVPKGKAWLGGAGGRPGDREVEFKDDFYMGVYPVTQEDWETVTGTNPALYSRHGVRKEAVKDVADADLKRFPVEAVSYADVESFLVKLNEKAKDAGWVYRLPTGDEWEYACRGGPVAKAASAFSFYVGEPSNELPTHLANYAHVGGPNRTVRVGRYPPNRLGLCDMHGNVLEWTADPDVNEINEVTRRARGSSWNDFARPASAYLRFLPWVRFPSLGLRVVRARPPAPVPLAAEQRKALEWVQSVGGTVDLVVDGNRRLPYPPGNKLPDGPVMVVGISLVARGVDDATVERLRDVPPVRGDLVLSRARLTDVGLIRLATYPALTPVTRLGLAGTGVTDAGLAQLTGWTALRTLELMGTKVTKAGVEKLSAGLPLCKIEWDGGRAGPKQ